MSKEKSNRDPEAGQVSTPEETPAVDPWATLTLTLQTQGDEAEQTHAADLLEALGGLLAELPEVGGVETRDASLLEFRVERPCIVAYTTPPHLESVQARALSLAHSMQLQFEASAEHRDDDDWRDSWKRFYRPMTFGDGALLLRPSWIERQAKDPARELVIDPGRAFGTGLHESTRLCLELLVRLLDDLPSPPSQALDLGCGSGILGLGALVLAPALERVHFVDIDSEAVDTSRENVEINGQLARASFDTGVVDDLDDTVYPLVIANIRPSVLLPHASAIASRVAPGGYLILSGILAEEAPEIAETYASLGLVERERPPMNDWCAFLYERPAAG